MTAPVNQELAGEKISYVSVNQEQYGKRWRISFVMPSSYNLRSLPAPIDDRIVLKQEPGFMAAAVRYAGMWRQKAYEEKKGLLLDWVRQNDLEISGTPIWARYDPPFMPWFLRRNEVIIPVKEK